MKATIFILPAILALQISILFAGNAETKSGFIKETSTVSIEKLTPSLAKEADFSTTPSIPKMENLILSPVTPKEADFNDSEDTTGINLRNMAPLTPAEADFE